MEPLIPWWRWSQFNAAFKHVRPEINYEARTLYLLTAVLNGRTSAFGTMLHCRALAFGAVSWRWLGQELSICALPYFTFVLRPLEPFCGGGLAKKTNLFVKDPTDMLGESISSQWEVKHIPTLWPSWGLFIDRLLWLICLPYAFFCGSDMK